MSLLVETAEGVRTLTFNRPERRNALTPAMYDALAESLRAADADPEVRVVVITGSGAAFTSGNDLGDFMNTPPAGKDSPVFRLLMALVDFEKPLVAVVNGTAIGIGVTMLLHCDLVYAAETAMLQMPFVGLGLVPEGGSSLLLPAIMGQAKASELLMLGEKFSAADAAALGLVTRCWPADQLADRVREKLSHLASRPVNSVKLTKRLLKGPGREAVKAAIEREGELFLERLTSPAAMEAFSAFFEKRAPDFRSVGE